MGLRGDSFRLSRKKQFHASLDWIVVPKFTDAAWFYGMLNGSHSDLPKAARSQIRFCVPRQQFDSSGFGLLPTSRRVILCKIVHSWSRMAELMH